MCFFNLVLAHSVLQQTHPKDRHLSVLCHVCGKQRDLASRVPRHHDFSRDISWLRSALWISSSPGSQPWKDAPVKGAKRISLKVWRTGAVPGTAQWHSSGSRCAVPSPGKGKPPHTSQAELCSGGSSSAPGGLVLPPWPRTFSSHHSESPTKLPFL